MALAKKKKIIVILGIGVLMSVLIINVMVAKANQTGIDPEILSKLKYKGENILVIKPRLTEAAYSTNGFYYYYNGTCGKECLSIPLNPGEPNRWGAYNYRTIALFGMLNYPIMDDSQIHIELLKDPNFLNRYDTIILLHSEYVTKELYQAITHHKHVIYMAPNALYAEVTFLPVSKPQVSYDTYVGGVHVTNMIDGQVTLIRGHGYPEKEISNGFGWKYDNTPQEYDQDCNQWGFVKIDNGYQLNCAPTMTNGAKIEIISYMHEVLMK